MNDEKQPTGKFEELKATLEEFRATTRTEVGELKTLFDPETLNREIFNNREVFEALAKDEERLFAQETEFVLEHSRATRGGPAKVANLGSGWGVFSRALIRKNPALTIYDEDFNPVVCQYDQAYNHKHATVEQPFNQIQNFVMDASQLGIANESVDEVLSFGVMRYIPENIREQVVDEAIRTTKPGGRVILGDINPAAVASFEQILDNKGIAAEKHSQEIEVLRATTFYFYYFLYKDLPLIDESVKENLPIQNFRETVDELASESGKTPIDILLDLAGKDKRKAEVLVFERV